MIYSDFIVNTNYEYFFIPIKLLAEKYKLICLYMQESNDIKSEFCRLNNNIALQLIFLYRTTSYFMTLYGCVNIPC